eukprot:5204517-Amphidinium_carterae.1
MSPSTDRQSLQCPHHRCTSSAYPCTQRYRQTPQQPQTRDAPLVWPHRLAVTSFECRTLHDA